MARHHAATTAHSAVTQCANMTGQCRWSAPRAHEPAHELGHKYAKRFAFEFTNENWCAWRPSGHAMWRFIVWLHFSAKCGECIMRASQVTFEIAAFFLDDF